MAEENKSNWFWRLLGGLILIFLGLLIIIYPGVTVAIVVILFGVLMLLYGLSQLVVALTAPGKDVMKWLFVISGTISIIIGLLAMFSPLETLVAGWILVAAWAVVWGIFEIVGALMVPADMVAQTYGNANGKTSALLVGVLAMLLGMVILVYPGSSLLSVIWLVGGMVIALGLLVLAGAAKLGRPTR